MAPAESVYCPTCGEVTSHRLVARTRLHVGTKRKWACDICEFLVVTLDDRNVHDPSQQADT